jgi:hypothetical protein
MAKDTVSALQNMSSSIKSGDFLSILGSAVNLFSQLASTGLFGKNMAARVNAVPGYAGGTSFHPGGLAMVGERGPELVNLPRGSRVYPNGTGPGGGASQVQIVPSKYFDVVVDGRVFQAAPAIAQAGVDTAQLAAQLQQQGAAAFTASWHALMGVIAARQAALAST